MKELKGSRTMLLNANRICYLFSDKEVDVFHLQKSVVLLFSFSSFSSDQRSIEEK